MDNIKTQHQRNEITGRYSSTRPLLTSMNSEDEKNAYIVTYIRVHTRSH